MAQCWNFSVTRFLLTLRNSSWFYSFMSFSNSYSPLSQNLLHFWIFQAAWYAAARLIKRHGFTKGLIEVNRFLPSCIIGNIYIEHIDTFEKVFDSWLKLMHLQSFRSHYPQIFEHLSKLLWIFLWNTWRFHQTNYIDFFLILGFLLLFLHI